MFLLGLSAYLSVGAVFAAFSLDRHFTDEFKEQIERKYKLREKLQQYVDDDVPGSAESVEFGAKAGYIAGGIAVAIALFFFYPVFCVIWLLKEKEA